MNRLLCTALGSTVFALSTPAVATEDAVPAADSNDSQALETIEVHGQRASNTGAIADKQTKLQIVDVISADDTRHLPDITVAQTIRRIPGVSVSFNDDNVHGRDEAERPVIRGLDARYNNSTLDGGALAAPDANNFTTGSGSSGTRGTRLDLLPTSMIQSLEVYKTWTADLDPNAVGGSVNIATLSALSNPGATTLDVNVAAGNVTNHGKPYHDDGLPKRADGTIATTFGPESRYGLVAAGDFQKIDTYTYNTATTDTVYYNWFTNAGKKVTDPSLSNGFPIPQNFKHFWFQDSRLRKGITLKLEAKPIDSLYAFASAGRYQSHQVETRNENFLSITPGTTPSPTNQTATSGSFAAGEAEVGYLHGPIDRLTNMLQTGVDWRLTDKQVLSLHQSDSRASFNENTPMVKYIYGTVYSKTASPGTAAQPGLAFNYDTSGFDPSFALQNPPNWTNLQNWQGFYWRQVLRQSHNAVDDTRLDYRVNLSPHAAGFGFAAGLNYRENSYHFNYDQADYYPTATGFSLADANGNSGLLLPYGGGVPYLMVNGDAAWQSFNNNRAAFSTTAATNTQNSLQDDYTFFEKIKGAYTMLGYNTDTLHGLLGVRYDSADVDTSAWNKVTNPDKSISWQQVPAEASYHNFLPSATLTYDLREDLKLRFGATRTIGRPDYGYYAPRTSVGLNTDGSVSITEGNPHIEPRRSTNLDASFEWYLGRTGMVSAAVFNKKIEDEIFVATQSNLQVAIGNGQTATGSISRPENASGARMRGFELNAVINSFDFVHPWLSGFGISSNYTYLSGRLDVIDADGKVRELDRMIGQPGYVANVTGFYTLGPVDLRLAWNHTGMSLRAVDTTGSWQDVFWKDRQQLDFTARYRIIESWSVFVEGTNLTREPVTSVTGPGRNLLKDSYSLGRTLWLGTTWTPKF